MWARLFLVTVLWLAGCAPQAARHEASRPVVASQLGPMPGHAIAKSRQQRAYLLARAYLERARLRHPTARVKAEMQRLLKSLAALDRRFVLAKAPYLDRAAVEACCARRLDTAGLPDTYAEALQANALGDPELALAWLGDVPAGDRRAYGLRQSLRRQERARKAAAKLAKTQAKLERARFKAAKLTAKRERLVAASAGKGGYRSANRSTAASAGYRPAGASRARPGGYGSAAGYRSAGASRTSPRSGSSYRSTGSSYRSAGSSSSGGSGYRSSSSSGYRSSSSSYRSSSSSNASSSSYRSSGSSSSGGSSYRSSGSSSSSSSSSSRRR